MHDVAVGRLAGRREHGQQFGRRGESRQTPLTLPREVPTFVGMLRTLLALAFLAAGCAPKELPSEIAISWDFSPEHRVMIEDGIDQWCAATGWCPRVMGEGSVGAAPIVALTGEEYARYHRSPYSVAFNRDDHAVYVNLDRLAMFPDRAWQTFAHELGHFGIDGHLDALGLLMSWSDCLDTEWVDEMLRCREKADPIFCIDYESSRSFCAQQGLIGCRSTCQTD